MDSSDKEKKLPLSARALVLLIAGLLIMIVGYVLMAGGGSSDPKVFNEAMFDARRLIIAPIVIAVGIIVEIIAIMGWFPKKKH